MNIRMVKDKINIEELQEIAKEFYYPMLKGAVDIEQGVVAFGGEYHIDANNVLMEYGSTQEHVWGFNIYLDRHKEDWLEYTALINIRPFNKNTSMEIEYEGLRDKIKEIVEAKII